MKEITDTIETCARDAWINLFIDARPLDEDVRTIVDAFAPLRAELTRLRARLEELEAK